MRLALLLIAISLTIGCGQSKKEPKQNEPQKGKSTLNTVVDGATGRTAVNAGKKAKDQIESISKKHNDDLIEVMGE